MSAPRDFSATRLMLAVVPRGQYTPTVRAAVDKLSSLEGRAHE